MENIFNEGAFKIKVKSNDPIKYLDGGYAFNITVEHFESGEPRSDQFEFRKDLIGHVHIDQL